VAKEKVAASPHRMQSSTIDWGCTVIEHAEGDLLLADADALVNTVNCVGVMGKGIALQFKRRYPSVFKAYEEACRQGEVTIGRMFVVPTNQLNGPRYVVNFPTKRHWRSPSRLEYIEDGLVDLRRIIMEYGIKSIAIPRLGAGNGGLDWRAVEPLIVQNLELLPNVTVKLFAPSTGH
jgi:O-acetyl-ADP-ribose deacetylase (regulator of RNase III)